MYSTAFKTVSLAAGLGSNFFATTKPASFATVAKPASLTLEEDRQFYDIADTNGDNAISAEELLQFFRLVGDESTTLDDTKAMVAEADINEDGKVSWEENGLYGSLLMIADSKVKISSSKPLAVNAEDKKFFAMSDVNHDGFMTVREYMDFMELYMISP